MTAHHQGGSGKPHRDRIINVLRVSRRALDDDQLSLAAGIAPRQTVNQVCRRLEREGLLQRYVGPDGKIVNELTSAPGAPTVVGIQPNPPATMKATSELPITRATGHEPPPGNSAEQKLAERLILDLLGAELGCTLEPATIRLPSGARAEIDGSDLDRTILAECWAHQGPPKPAQKHKVLADALKLVWIAQTIYPRPRLILCMSDAAASQPFIRTSRSWAAQALQDLEIEVVVVDLPAEVRQRLLGAQRRQYR